MEPKITSTVGEVLETTTDRISTMETEELRRTCQKLMMIGNTQMEVIRDQREKIDSMSSDMREMEYEKADAVNKAVEAEAKITHLDKMLAQSNRDIDRLVTENTAYAKIIREFPKLSVCMLVVAIVEAVALCLALIF